MDGTMQLYHGDCLTEIKKIASGSVDCVITDPPYPMIKRDYGMMTEAEWMTMMQSLVPEVRRVLKPTGSAVFILQPNSKKLGSMRLWLWEFMVWVGKEWNIVQDAYWWNITAMTEAHSIQGRLMRPSLKYVVWCGPSDCYRNQDAVLWTESDANKQMRLSGRATKIIQKRPSGQRMQEQRAHASAARRGGVLPFNVLPMGNGRSVDSAGAHGHGAGTPFEVADWWTRYICPPHGTVLDPFMGSGTMGLAALKNDCDFVGIEKLEKYYHLSKTRIEAEQERPKTMRMELAPP